jgi:hypothetical protein
MQLRCGAASRCTAIRGRLPDNVNAFAIANFSIIAGISDGSDLVFACPRCLVAWVRLILGGMRHVHRYQVSIYDGKGEQLLISVLGRPIERSQR